MEPWGFRSAPPQALCFRRAPRAKAHKQLVWFRVVRVIRGSFFIELLRTIHEIHELHELHEAACKPSAIVTYETILYIMLQSPF